MTVRDTQIYKRSMPYILIIIVAGGAFLWGRNTAPPLTLHGDIASPIDTDIYVPTENIASVAPLDDVFMTDSLADETPVLVEHSSVVYPHVQTDERVSHETYRVLSVVDGDTLTVDMDGVSQTLRLIGLDTPETVDPRKPVQCFGKEASQKAKNVLTGKRVRIERDVTQGVYDKYNRLLAYVFLEDGTFFNEMMIREGYGHEYTYATPYAYQTLFQEAEHDARANGRGLWAVDACAGDTTSPPTPSVTTSVVVSSTTSGYTCATNTYNCTDFSTQMEAQHVFEECGGTNNDIHRLDSDKDGRVCESLP
ncbi:MAG: thermonuclease family protein [Candidatus Yonathbacteria bacterium]|nr:thermonuclease family protein [Candidatus Yonathbacteria bacterium]NTW47496.1 thermonuclease family protein [Candidatus Yonathbacteria bacterium]